MEGLDRGGRQRCGTGNQLARTGRVRWEARACFSTLAHRRNGARFEAFGFKKADSMGTRHANKRAVVTMIYLVRRN